MVAAAGAESPRTTNGIVTTEYRAVGGAARMSPEQDGVNDSIAAAVQHADEAGTRHAVQQRTCSTSQPMMKTAGTTPRRSARRVCLWRLECRPISLAHKFVDVSRYVFHRETECY